MSNRRKKASSNSENSRISVETWKIKRLQEILLEWSKSNYADFPWRSTTNSFNALVAEIMLQRTRAEQVVPVFLKFTSGYQSSHDVTSANPEQILKLLKPLGLKWRAEKIIELARELDQRNNTIPEKFEEMLSLPGVGHYVASAFLSFHRAIRAPIIDSNVVRLWSRVFGFRKKEGARRKKGFLQLAEQMTPAKDFKQFNYAILDFTRTVCRPKPLCNKCPISTLCLDNARGNLFC